jgi:hypothetical protein
MALRAEAKNSGKRSAKRRFDLMKALIVLGSIVGFLAGAALALTSNSTWPTALWRACVAALAAAILTRWWSRIWVQSLRDSLEQRQRPRPSNPKQVVKT